MDLEGKIKISDLKQHKQNSYYFDDVEGDAWDSLLQSISTSGVTNAITITDKKVIISGHQRVRACKVLGINEISYKMIHYDDEEKEIKDLIESNLRQRSLGSLNPVKMGRCFSFLNDYYGFEQGGDHGNQYTVANEKVFHLANSDEPKTQKELAESHGITQQTMNNYMRLADTIPELEELVDTGIVTKTTALAMIKNLSEDEQLNLEVSENEERKNFQDQKWFKSSNIRTQDGDILHKYGNIKGIA